jgi:thioredoxin reductase
MSYDVVIVGGGPSGLSAALALGRARKRVLLCDAGPRRNAAAVHMHNFVTRDGTAPDEFRRIAREQLTKYPKVEVRDVRVESIAGARGAFRVSLAAEGVAEVVDARRIILSTGMIDEPLAIPGFRELWGKGVFQCPYCHGWEVQDRAWGYVVRAEDVAHVLPFGLMIRGWSGDVTVFTNGVELASEVTAPLRAAGVKIEPGSIARLVGGETVEAVEVEGGRRVPCDALFVHPPQRQVDIVRSLGLALDEHGFVQVDPMKRETSVPGIYATGDITTRMQAAVMAASSGAMTAAMVNMELTMELAMQGAL